ncbi:hypothetical protein K469DRAFT_695455 [Zopfia rhizophila CBS 207.26]|uniref:Uncharacterized protein n=1 Tax=Zopfia rhizophila CBS 207.26 TaxID=1314779 RepID=A0A6A6DJN8_9PEZI|nr:hypothetical protein K469DRAFT_695455 [Zopfia rhizophila CBS 207.26]
MFRRECIPGKCRSGKCSLKTCAQVFDRRPSPLTRIKSSNIPGAGRGLFAGEDTEKEAYADASIDGSHKDRGITYDLIYQTFEQQPDMASWISHSKDIKSL